MSNKTATNPLIGLLGTWEGDKGIDLAPKPEEDENNPYYETLTIEPLDIEIENAEIQELTAVKYTQVVREIANNKISHSETGYWIWDQNEDTIMCAFAIPRGVSVLAGGNFENTSNNEIAFNVSTISENDDWGIVQSPFMKKKAKTVSFTRNMTLSENTLSYTQETKLDIYGKKFDHIDTNILTKKGNSYSS